MPIPSFDITRPVVLLFWLGTGKKRIETRNPFRELGVLPLDLSQLLVPGVDLLAQLLDVYVSNLKFFEHSSRASPDLDNLATF